jgi:energy-coupling factor transport system permease protein
MDAEIYLDYNTFMHRLDPRVKITLFLIIFIGVLQFEHPLWLLPTAGFVLLMLAASRALKNLGRIRYVLLVLTISSIVIWNIFASGQTPLFWFVEAESLFYSFSRTILMLSIITMGMVLISTTRNEELVLGMIRMGLPYRIGFAISTSLRLVPTIAASTLTISQAQRSRGLDLEGGSILERLRKFIPLLIPVFISTIRSTNIFGMALESRGFGARDKRTFYMELSMKAADYTVMAVALVYLVLSIYLNLAGYGNLIGLTRF